MYQFVQLDDEHRKKTNNTRKCCELVTLRSSQKSNIVSNCNVLALLYEVMQEIVTTE